MRVQNCFQSELTEQYFGTPFPFHHHLSLSVRVRVFIGFEGFVLFCFNPFFLFICFDPGQ